MTARQMLVIDHAWRFVPDDPYDVLAGVEAERVVLRRAGTDEQLEFDAADWLALVAFVAAQTMPASPIPTYTTGVLPCADAPTTHSPAPGGPSDATVIARLRELSPDGASMPSTTIWDANRGSLPTKSTLVKRRRWAEWGELAGLRAMTTRDGGRLAHINRQDVAAEQPATPFRHANGTGA